MRLLKSFAVGKDQRRIELLTGDLSAIPVEHAVDTLVVSAFPDDYLPTRTSLIGALDRQGLVFRGLAYDKAVDLRQNFGCWLSKPLDPSFEDLHFKRILCFEPLTRGPAPDVVGEVFQALAPFCFAEPCVRSVAMPILATGDQGNPVSAMLPPLIDAAIHWLSIGFPVDVLKIVVRDDQTSEAEVIFDERITFAISAGKEVKRVSVQPAQRVEYDVFVSHAEEDSACADYFCNALSKRGVSTYNYRASNRNGAAWQQKIFDVLDDCLAVAAFYSPHFVASKICKMEFNIAIARQMNADREILFPILVSETSLPTYMRILNYIDCRPNDHDLIGAAAERLLQQLAK